MEEVLLSSDPISIACERGNLEVVTELLSRGYDPTKNENYALYIATARRYTEIIDLLLSTGRVNPTDGDNSALMCTVTENNVALLRKFLNYPCTDPATFHNLAIVEACTIGHLQIVQALLSDRRVDPGARDNEALIAAARERHPEVVQLLICGSGNRIDPSARDNILLRCSDDNNWIALSRLISLDLRVDPSRGVKWETRRDIIRTRVGDSLLGLVAGYYYSGGLLLASIRTLLDMEGKFIRKLLTTRAAVTTRLLQAKNCSEAVTYAFQLLSTDSTISLEQISSRLFSSERYNRLDVLLSCACIGAQLGGSSLVSQGILIGDGVRASITKFLDTQLAYIAELI